MATSCTTVVVGCGMAGLGAAHALRQAAAPYVIIEREHAPGGLVRSDRVGLFLFDRAGHFLHSCDGPFRKAVENSGVSFRRQVRRSAVILDGRIVPYPLQFNLWAAPPALRAAVRQELEHPREMEAAADDLDGATRAAWGTSLTEAFFTPYHEKLLGVPLDHVPAHWGAQFIPKADRVRMKEGIERPIDGYGYNATFSYPNSAQLGDLPDALAAPHRTRLRFQTAVSGIDSGRRCLVLESGETIPFGALVVTISLPRMLELAQVPFPAKLFAHANLVNVRVGFRGRIHRPEHWFYVPSRDVPFFRIGVPSNVDARTCPDGCGSLSIECGLGEHANLTGDPRAIASHALEFLESHSVLSCDGVECVDSHLIAPAYVFNRMSVTPAISALAERLASDGIMVAGRFGAWDYLSMDQAFHSGMNAGTRAMDWMKSIAGEAHQ